MFTGDTIWNRRILPILHPSCLIHEDLIAKGKKGQTLILTKINIKNLVWEWTTDDVHMDDSEEEEVEEEEVEEEEEEKKHSVFVDISKYFTCLFILHVHRTHAISVYTYYST